MNNNVIIVAGGKGLRMESDLPKQFIPIGGKPILMHTIDAFYRFDNEINIVLVLSIFYQDYWKELCCEYGFETPHLVVAGGETRFHSVLHGLEFVHKGVVGVHDGVRPFATTDLITRCYDTAATYNAVIPVLPSTDSLREMTDDVHSRIIDRSRIRLVQTPQVFDVQLLKRAYETGYKEYFTDDASVVEVFGHRVHLVEGETTNIKITTPFDLKVGEAILGDIQK